jgi:hypothetical protein
LVTAFPVFAGAFTGAFTDFFTDVFWEERWVMAIPPLVFVEMDVAAARDRVLAGLRLDFIVGLGESRYCSA